jgi:hypothetical protein
MKMLMEVELPNEPFSTLVKKGTAGQTIQGILDEIKPSAAYFSEQDGQRGAFLLVEVEDSSRIPALAEPFFVRLDASVRFRVCMTPEDLAHSGLDEIGRRLSKDVDCSC